MDNYTGYKELTLSTDELAEFYTTKALPGEFLTNQYALLHDENGDIVDKQRWTGAEFVPVRFSTIKSTWSGTIKPLNPGQELAIDMLRNRDIKVKLLRGVFGSGKDFLMLNYALECVEKGQFDKIVFVRPNVSVAGVPEIGYLKGDLSDKLLWTLGPLYDKVGGQEGVDMLIAKGQLEMAPLLFIRGRSFENSIIYVCEGQNMTSDVIKLLLGRVGEGSELWINGDAKQVDGKLYEKDNGIALMLERLSGHPLFGYVYLSKTERSEVAELATLLD